MKIMTEWIYCPECGIPVVYDEYGNILEVSDFSAPMGGGQIVDDIEHECNP